MKKKITGIIIALGLLIWIIVVLVQNKQEMQEELKAIQQADEPVPVQVATAAYKQIDKEIEESGMFYASTDVDVMSETEGEVTAVKAGIGDRVAAGQVLATTEREVLESQLELAEEEFHQAQRELRRNENLAEGEAVSGQKFEDARLRFQQAKTQLTSVRKQFEDAVITSPIDGMMSARNIEKGTYLTPGMHAFTISNQRMMHFRMRVSGTDLPLLSVGDSGRVRADALSARRFRGTVTEIGVAADDAGRYLVEVAIPNPDHLIRSGMTGRGSMVIPRSQKQLIIPRKSIEGSIEEAQVFVVKGGKAVRRSIEAELLGHDQAIVLSGLQEGEDVVTTGLINLDDGSKVKIMNNNPSVATP